MPVTVKEGLPALSLLADENIFVMGEEEAVQQDIRELRLLIC
ncbi:MAG: homoserine O-succinyltransferase, partial [Bradymonadia bacterium]